jgi:hypothetical protein
MAFRFLVETSQVRVVEPGVSTLASGEDWDLAFSSQDVFVDPATDTLMCRPGCEYGDWENTNTGIFAKWSRGDFTTVPGAGDAGWPDADPVVNPGDGPWIYYPNNTVDVEGLLNFSLDVNQAVNAEWYAPPKIPADAIAGEIGWNNAITGANGVSVRFYYGGRAEVWKDGLKQGEYTMSGQKKHRRNKNKAAKAAAPSAQYVRVTLIPCRGRELVVMSSMGAGFTHVFEDIPEGTVGASITTASPFWFRVPAGSSVNHRFSLCQFSAGGDAFSTASKFRVDPTPTPDGGFQSWQLADLTGGTVALSPADAVGGGAYLDNVRGVRIKASLVGVGGRSPFVFAARIYTKSQTASTPDGPIDITRYLEAGAGIESTDTNSGVTGHATFRNSPAIEALGVVNFATKTHRSFQIIDDDDVVWVDGVMMPPETEVDIVFDADGKATYEHDGSNGAETVSFALRDRMQLAEEYQFYDDAPHDGELLADAFTADAQQMGFQAAEIHCSDFDGFRLPGAGDVTDRNFNVVQKAGDHGQGALQRYHETFAANAFFGLDPDGGLQLTAAGEMPTEPVATLYDSLATMDRLGETADYRLLIRKLKVIILGPEANDVFAVGMDYRTRRPLIAHKRDDGSIDPTLPPGDRPLNHVGSILSFSQGSPQLATQEACNWACGLNYDRLTPVRAIVEIECDGKAKYRRGQVLRLELLDSGLPRALAQIATAPGINGLGIIGTSVFGRIKSFSSQFDQVAVPDESGRAMSPWRPGRYVLQVLDGVSDAANMHVRATTARGIREEVRNRMGHRKGLREFLREFPLREPIGHFEVP